MAKDDAHTITSPFVQIFELELAPLASQMHEQFTPAYIARECVDALGEDNLARVTDAQRKLMQSDWMKKFDFFKTTIPIPDALAERCFGADSREQMTARGEAVKLYGEAAVLAEAKKRGFATLTAMKATAGPAKTAKTPDTSDASRNPWSPRMVFRTEAERQAKQIEIIKVSAKLAANLAKSAGRTISGQPLRT